MRRILLATGILALITQPLFAEMIVLKNGRVLEGKTVGKTDEYVTLDVNGVNHTYRTDEIAYMGEAVKKAPVGGTPAETAPEPEADTAPVADTTNPAALPTIIEEVPEPDVQGTIADEAPAPAGLSAPEIPATEAVLPEAPNDAPPAVGIETATEETPGEEVMPTEASPEPAAAIPVAVPAEDTASPEGTLNPEETSEPADLNVEVLSDEEVLSETEEPIEEATEETPPEDLLEEPVE